MIKTEKAFIFAIVLVLIFMGWSIINECRGVEEYSNPVCRDQFGHKVECE